MKKTALVMKVFLGILVSSLLLTVSSVKSYAASSLSLSPASGTIDADGTTLTLKFNSDGASLAGASVKISFTGSVTYVSSSSTACTQSFDVQKGTGAVVVSCLFSDTKTFNGNLATLNFKSSASSGTSTFTLSNVDPSEATLAGGTYTLVSTSDGEGLPSTGIFDTPIYLVVGGILISFGIVLFTITKRKERLFLNASIEDYEDFLKSPKMKDKVDNR